MSSSDLTADSSVSGYISFEMARAHGAAITEAEIREDASICMGTWCKHQIRDQNQKLGGSRKGAALTPKEMNAPITLPAMVANPPVMTAWISDLVMVPR